MIKVKTKSGFETKIDESIMNRYSFVKLLGKVDKNPLVITELITTLLGDDEEKLIEHLGGNPTVDEISQELGDIFECIGESKEAKNF